MKSTKDSTSPEENAEIEKQKVKHDCYTLIDNW